MTQFNWANSKYINLEYFAHIKLNTNYKKEVINIFTEYITFWDGMGYNRYQGIFLTKLHENLSKLR